MKKIVSTTNSPGAVQLDATVLFPHLKKCRRHEEDDSPDASDEDCFSPPVASSVLKYTGFPQDIIDAISGVASIAMCIPNGAAFSMSSSRTVDKNEDFAILFSQHGQSRIGGVFDGVGGGPHAQETSRLTGELCRELLRHSTTPPSIATIQQLVGTIQTTLSYSKIRQGATTATVAIRTPNASQPGIDDVWILSMGDSRAYIYENDHLSHASMDNLNPAAILNCSDESSRSHIQSANALLPYAYIDSNLYTGHLFDLPIDPHRLCVVIPVCDLSAFLTSSSLQYFLSTTTGENLSYEERNWFQHRNITCNIFSGICPIIPCVYTTQISSTARIILATDGVTDNLTDDELLAAAQVFSESENGMALHIVNAAIKQSKSKTFRSKPDDATVVVM